MNILTKLNSEQKRAVQHIKGPALVIAGPGTGKTHTITMRIVHLIQGGVSPENIIAITFTNRASTEIKQRIQSSLSSESDKIFIGTFHKLGLEIINRVKGEGSKLINREEQIDLIKDIAPNKRAETLCERISLMKNLLRDADDEIKDIYERYQVTLERKGLFDLDDLILIPHDLLSNPDLRQQYSEHFQYILIDEYQDMNPLQHSFVKQLINNARNIFAVGDADQAIYSFRGANVHNFLRFKEDFPDAEIYILKDNYRSTSTIIRVATEVIEKNRERIDKEIRASRENGQELSLVSLPDELSEARYIAQVIEEKIGGIGHYNLTKNRYTITDQSYSLSDFAVLVRINALIQPIKKALTTAGIPCRVLTNSPLYEHESAKTVISYGRFILNPADNISLLKIINIPHRGIGEKTQQKLTLLANKNNCPLCEILKRESDENKKLKDFLLILEHFQKLKETFSLEELIKKIIFDTGIDLYFDREREVIEGILNLAYGLRKMPLTEGFKRLEEELILKRLSDFYNPKVEVVNILTIHAAKGLEFPIVFIAGAEDGIIPLNLKGCVDLEEERRLLYVAMTRAKDELYISHVRRRFLFGNRLSQNPSPFLIFNSLKKEINIPDPLHEKRQRQVNLF